MRATARLLVLSALLTVVMLVSTVAQAQATEIAPLNYRHLATVGAADDWGYDLGAPWDIAVDRNGFMYVTDLGNRSLVKISPDYHFVKAVRMKLPPNTLVVAGMRADLQAPTGVSVLGDRVYVADGEDIAVFSTDLTFVRTFENLAEQMGWASGLEATTGFFGPDTLYVGDIGLHRVYYTHLPEEGMITAEVVGQEVPHWGSYGTGDGELRSPCAIACTPDGSAVYVLDRDNHRVQRFTVDGHFARSWGMQGTGPGWFRRPQGIATGPDGTVFVADTDNHRIQRFSDNGEFIQQWGTNGGPYEPMGLREPCGITVDAQGRVYVCDARSRVIKIYGPRLTLVPIPRTIQRLP